MPGDTKIKHCPSGWFDVDNPTVFHSTRWQARAARRNQNKTTTWKATVAISTPVTPQATANAIVQSLAAPTPSVPDDAVKVHDSAILSPLSSLQQRLVDRLTTQQGVSLAEALVVVSNNGYNKAASYGHMREAGATHAEAEIVIGLDSPVVSVAYGLKRAAGYSHTYALQRALMEGQVLTDDDDQGDQS